MRNVKGWWQAVLSLGLLSVAAVSSAADNAGVRAVVPGAAAGVRKILFLGNSITLIPSWEDGCGMAATAKEKDYVHIVTRAISRTTGTTPEILVRNIAKFERQFATFDVEGTFKEEFGFKADLVVIAIGENVPRLDSAAVKAQFHHGLTRLLRGLSANRPTIVVRSCFWPNQDRDPILKQACQEAGGIYVDIGSLSKDESNYARSERKIEHKGVAAHPGDKGMLAIANAILTALNNQRGKGTDPCGK